MANRKKGRGIGKHPSLKPTARKITILKVEPIPPATPDEPPRQRVELEVEAAPIPLPDHPVAFPVEIVPDEFVATHEAYVSDDLPLTVPEEKKGIINWLRSWWN